MNEDRVKAVAAMKPIKTQEEIAAELGVCRSTVQRDLEVVKREGLDVPVFSTEAAEIRAKEVISIKEEIAFLKADAESLPVSPRQIFLRAQILDRRIKLLELATPKVSANVNVDVKGPLYFEFLEHVARLSPANQQKVFDFADSLPRECIQLPEDLFWDPNAKQLEGEMK